MATTTDPDRPTMIVAGQEVPIPDDAYEAWLANGAPTEPPPPPSSE